MTTTSGTRVGLALAFTAGMAAATVAAYGQGAVAPTPTPPRVLSGADVGFRLEGFKGNTPVGTLVVRMNGEWVEVDYSAGIKRLSK